MNKQRCPLAIVGMSCLFPKADDLQAYWANIKNGVDAITPIPIGSHWNVADYFDDDPKSPDRTYAQRGGFLSPVDFNPMEFGMRRRTSRQRTLRNCSASSRRNARSRTPAILPAAGRAANTIANVPA